MNSDISKKFKINPKNEWKKGIKILRIIYSIHIQIYTKGKVQSLQGKSQKD